MASTLRSVPARLLLLCTLIFGVVTMHHVASGHGGAATSMPAGMSSASAVVAGATPMGPHAEPPDHDGAHSMLHLCLAVLIAAAILLLARFLTDGVDAGGVARHRSRGREPARPPPVPLAGRRSLAARCGSDRRGSPRAQVRRTPVRKEMTRKILAGFVLPAIAALVLSACSPDAPASHNDADVTFARQMIASRG
jgi:hypothetical protein